MQLTKTAAERSPVSKNKRDLATNQQRSFSAYRPTRQSVTKDRSDSRSEHGVVTVVVFWFTLLEVRLCKRTRFGLCAPGHAPNRCTSTCSFVVEVEQQSTTRAVSVTSVCESSANIRRKSHRLELFLWREGRKTLFSNVFGEYKNLQQAVETKLTQRNSMLDF